MKHLITMFFLCSVQFAFSQGSTCISYIQKGSSYSIINGEPIYSNKNYAKTGFVTLGKLYYNDSLAFFYLYPEGKTKFGDKRKTIGDQLIHHAIFFDIKNNETLSEVAVPAGTKLLLIMKPDSTQWFSIDRPKKILGYDCEAAYTVSSKGDSAFVWYAPQLGTQLGPNYYYGFPGMVLEVRDSWYRTNIIATKIEHKPITIVEPMSVEKISGEEFDRRRSIK